MTSAVRTLAQSWLAGKQSIEASVPFHHDWLHLAAGLVIYVAVRTAALRQSRLVPWTAALFLGILNEAVDFYMPHTPRIYRESAVDLVATMALPTFLYAAERVRRRGREVAREG